jgi:hypothetical protein
MEELESITSTQYSDPFTLSANLNARFSPFACTSKLFVSTY